MARACSASRVAKVEVYSPSAAMRRSLMPVLEVIQSSLVSTIPVKSRFDKIRSGAAEPVPVIFARTICLPSLASRRVFHGLSLLHVRGKTFFELLGHPLGYTLLGVFMGKTDGVLDRLCIGATMTDHADPVD